MYDDLQCANGNNITKALIFHNSVNVHEENWHLEDEAANGLAFIDQIFIGLRVLVKSPDQNSSLIYPYLNMKQILLFDNLGPHI